MPSFGRLGKHSNRSQHGISEQQQPPSASLSNTTATATTTAGPHPTGGVGVGISGAQHQQPPSTAAGSLNISDTPPTDSLLDNTVGTALTTGSHDHVDPRQLPPQQAASQSTPNKLQKQPPNPPPHLYNTTSSSSPTSAGGNPSSLPQNPAGDVFFDGRQHQSPTDFADSAGVSRSQSERYPSQHSLHLQQQQQQQQQQGQPQQIYGVATSSVDELPSPASFHQQQPAQPLPQQSAQPPPEKPRSNRTRHIIKGIFGSVRGTQDTTGSNSNSNSNNNNISNPQIQPPPQIQGQSPIQGGQSPSANVRSGSYDNTTGLARRPSKRVSNLSRLSTSLPHQASLVQDSQGHPSQNQTQLVDVDEDREHYYTPQDDSNPSPLSQDSRLPLGAARPIGIAIGDVDSKSPYQDEEYQPPPHPPPGHQQQEQPQQFDPSQRGFDNASISSSQQQQLHQQLLFQQNEGRLPTGYSYNAETASQLSQDSHAVDQDLRAHAPQILQPGVNPQSQTGVVSSQQGTRRSQDTERALRGQTDIPPGAPAGYRQSNAGLNPTSPMPQPSSQSTTVYRERGAHFEGAAMEQRGDSPQPSTSEKDVESEKAFKELREFTVQDNLQYQRC